MCDIYYRDWQTFLVKGQIAEVKIILYRYLSNNRENKFPQNVYWQNVKYNNKLSFFF